MFVCLFVFCPRAGFPLRALPGYLERLLNEAERRCTALTGYGTNAGTPRRAKDMAADECIARAYTTGGGAFASLESTADYNNEHNLARVSNP